jgi:ATP synthase protein I
MKNRGTFWLLALAMELGFSVAIPLVVLAYLGSWADNQFGTKPLFLILGVLVGVFSGFYNIFRLLNYHRDDRPTGRDDRD